MGKLSTLESIGDIFFLPELINISSCLVQEAEYEWLV